MTLSNRTRDILLLLGLCFLCFFLRLGAIGLFDFNEGFYTQVSREMVLRNDFITPRVNGVYFFDKPPLALWCTALSFKVFGFSEFAARLPVAIAATLLVLLTYWFGAKFFNRRAGLFAGAMVALNPMLVGTARQMTMDIHQSLWFAVAMVTFFLGYTATSKRDKLWYYAFWASCGMAFLAKSAPGLFPIVVCFVFLLFQERWQIRPIMRRIWEAKPLPGLLLLLAVVLPWHYLAWRASGPIFYEEYWLLHHVKLLSGKDFNHAQPIWFYIPMLLGGFFPWSIFLPWALKRPKEEVTDQAIIARRYVLTWGIVVFAIFTIMKSKLISYLLPMYPAAALLIGDWLDRVLRTEDEKAARGLKFGALLIVVAGFLGLAAAQFYSHKALSNEHMARDLAREFPTPVWNWAVNSLTLGALGGGIAGTLFWYRKREAGVWALFGTMTVFIGLAVTEGVSAMEATKMAPLQDLARELGRHLFEGKPVAIHIGGPRRPSVFFYLPDSAFMTTMLPTSPTDDGLVLERGEPEPIIAFLNTHEGAYVLTDTERADVLMAAVKGLTPEKRNAQWVLLSKYRVMSDSKQPQTPAPGGAKP
jgi:4-amino-4-deoxy-L-arabinose transferase-like glycosyltransferase